MGSPFQHIVTIAKKGLFWLLAPEDLPLQPVVAHTPQKAFLQQLLEVEALEEKAEREVHPKSFWRQLFEKENLGL